MEATILQIDAPEQYGNAVLWALGIVQTLRRQGKKVLDVEPIVNKRHELERIYVRVV